MNLLLLLSALLSALTGVQVGARAPQATIAVAQVTSSVTAARAPQAVLGDRPAASTPTLVAAAQPLAGSAFHLTPAAPLYLSRRRE